MSARVQRCQRGVVMIEMLIVMVPLLLTFLGVIQVSLLSVAHLVVRHAAQRGVRSAVVVLEDDPVRYGASPRGHLGAPSADSGPSETLRIRAEASSSLEEMARALIERDPSRLNAIRAAVYLPLVVVAPSFWNVASSDSSVRAVIDPGALSRLAGGLTYNLVATAVTFPMAPGSASFRTHDYGPTDEVTVRVTNLFKCEIPIVNAILCDSMLDLWTGLPVTAGGDAATATARGDWRGARDAVRDAQARKERLKSQEHAMQELKQVELPRVQKLLMLSGGRFTTIRAEATLPIQGARYYPRQP